MRGESQRPALAGPRGLGQVGGLDLVAAVEAGIAEGGCPGAISSTTITGLA